MKNTINNQAGMLGDMFLGLVANLKQGVIYFIKQACGNEIMPSVYTVCNYTVVISSWPHCGNTALWDMGTNIANQHQIV